MPCKINNNSNFDITEIEDLIQDLFSFSQDRFGFKNPPVLNLMSDESNSSPLGKTAYYDPNVMEISIFVDDRHPKDIMRSFSHELIHHNQNENGMFDEMQSKNGDGYAQSNPHLRKMEKEAYLKGNMCFRDWEDGYKSSNPNILNERRIYKMSIKKWKNKELNGLLNERWGFSMNLNKLNENKKPDYIDIDGDGDKEESMKDAAKDKEEGSDESDEKVDEIRMRSGGLGKTPKEETDSAKKVSPFAKKSDNLPKPKLKEAEEEMSVGQRLQQVTALRDALRQGIRNDTGLTIQPEKMAALIDMVIDAASKDPKARTLGYKKFSKVPPQGGGNDDSGTSGAPAQIQEEVNENKDK
ncbi:hypothetical protein N8467_00595 [bacterium]|nr:hypothetical protein [bacterium]